MICPSLSLWLSFLPLLECRHCGDEALKMIGGGVTELISLHRQALSARNVELVELITAYQIHKSCEAALDTLDALADTVMTECCHQGARDEEIRENMRRHARRFLANAQYISHAVIDSEQEGRLMAPFVVGEGHCSTNEEIREAVDLLIHRLLMPLIEDALSAFGVPNTLVGELEPTYAMDKAVVDLATRASAAVLNQSGVPNADFIDFLHQEGRVPLKPAHSRGTGSLSEVCAPGSTDDPTACSRSAGYLFKINLFPPFNTSVDYHGSALIAEHGSILDLDGAFRRVHEVPYYISRSAALSSVRAIFHSINHWAPESVFVHPVVGNCRFTEKLLTATVKPRRVNVPINPLLGFETVVIPDHEKWVEEHGQRELIESADDGLHCYTAGRRDALSADGAGVMYNTSCMNLSLSDVTTVDEVQSRCSLEGAHSLLKSHGYVLESIEDPSIAVFRWLPDASENAQRLEDVFHRDWVANPLSRYHPIALARKQPWLSTVSSSTSYWTTGERPIPWTPLADYHLLKDHRGKCSGKHCDCYPPFRGRLCEEISKPRKHQERPYKAVIHYLVPDRQSEISELAFALGNLWEMYNHRRDIPVIIFHDGLSLASRKQLVEASENRLWFVYVEFEPIPSHVLEEMEPQPSSLGYRKAIRWRSWPIYNEECWRRFDYALTLDTDSYLPGQWDNEEDVFDYMHARNLTAVFTHFGRESAAAAVNFLQYFLLYCKMHDIDPRCSPVAKSLIEANFKWYQQVFELDFEAVKLSWSRTQHTETSSCSWILLAASTNTVGETILSGRYRASRPLASGMI
ncbi:hypothetical protein FOZ61_007258 [Perkinsus olseni]|uniref:Alpha 1,2-mannosyltransferase 2.4.1 n=1 Tax=Perkinsus olseni TaxID=32597 RepID=A0A7J6L9S3_PEROL|nr:hypothetical protein FOZ61_007258 [Perkinsus olseni]